MRQVSRCALTLSSGADLSLADLACLPLPPLIDLCNGVPWKKEGRRKQQQEEELLPWVLQSWGAEEVVGQ